MFPSVTTILNVLSKPFLPPWAAKMAAEYAVKNWQLLTPMVGYDPTGAVDQIKGASKRYTENASTLGTQIHQQVEQLVIGHNLNPWLTPQTNHFKTWQMCYKPKFLLSEATVYNRTERYAGTFDLLAEIEGKNILIDVKSGKSVYPEVALQLVAYAHGEFLGGEGVELPVPKVDGAAVLHLRPRSYKFIPVRIDNDVWQAFRYVKEAYRWQSSLSKTVLNENGESNDEW